MKFAAALLLGYASAYERLEESELAFMNWIAKYGKTYGTKEEYAFRLANFKKVYEDVQEMNAKYTSTTHGTNWFSDWSEEEQKKLNGEVEGPPQDARTVPGPAPGTEFLPVDWRESGAVSKVKNQGACGSCWTFSASGMVEGATAIKRGEPANDYSAQQVLDCCTVFQKGCEGGDKKIALKCIHMKPLDFWDDYTYDEAQEACRWIESKADSHVTQEAYTENEMTNDAIKQGLKFGPVGMSIAGSSRYLKNYKSGIMDDADACGTTLNHAVLCVGWGIENGVEYFIVKNSWGDWGEGGFGRFGMNGELGVCGYLGRATVNPLVSG